MAPTPVFLPGESQGWESLVGCHLWGRTELDMTEATQQQQQHGPNSPGSHAILFFTALDLASITSPILSWVLFLLWLCLFILSGVISPLISSSILGIYQPWEFIFQSYLFAFSYCLWGSQGRNTEWFAIPFSRGPHFVRTLNRDLSILGGPRGHDSQFH